MHRLEVKSENKKSEIVFGQYDIISQKVEIPDDAIFITDDNLANIYGGFLNDKKLIVIEHGDKNKNLSTMDFIYEQLIRLGAARKSFIIGFGGGMLTDIAGFAASTFMRGIRFGFIPTSLLSMVDASIGGKNGVNHHRFKNMIGTFNQPEFVLIDSSFLKTLPDEEYFSGMGEALKHFLIDDRKQFYAFLENPKAYLNKENVSDEFLFNQAKVKVDIVNRDIKESGERKKLNFGHTFGHAIEKLTGIKHGYAVSIGMVIATNISYKLGLLSTNEVNDIIAALKSAGLPTETHISRDSIIDAMHKDKKRAGDRIDFIALESIGKAKIIPMKITGLEELFK